MVDSFQATSYQVGQIVRALTSDQTGNLIFRDEPNPEGATLTRLLSGLIGSNIFFDSSSNFYVGVSTLQQALEYLNQFAYLKYASKFIYVDPTIPAALVSAGEVYNNIKDAITYANSLTFNGYNSVNILVMGMHRENASDLTTDTGVFLFDGSENIIITANGLNLIGVGNPVFRIAESIGTSTERKELFKIQTNSANEVRVNVSDISFEFVSSSYTTAFKVADAPGAGLTKERNGFILKNTTVSFLNGTNDNNRLVDIDSPTTSLPTSVLVDGLTVGSISNVVPSLNAIQLLRINHATGSRLTVKDLDFTGNDYPNPNITLDEASTTSFTAITVQAGSCVVMEPKLDEKFYWNGILSQNSFTKLLYAASGTKVSIFNPSIIRNSYNTQVEIPHGITTVNDWLNIQSGAIINVVGGFDERYDVDVKDVTVSVATSGTTGVGTSGTTGTSGTEQRYDVKPLKSFWNKDKIGFGIGNRGDVRFGKASTADISDYLSKYNIDSYGVPFFFNEDTRKFQYFDGTNLRTVSFGGSGGAGATMSVTVTAIEWIPASYNYGTLSSFLGYQYTLNHNFGLTNPYAFTYTIFDTTNGIQIQAQQVMPNSTNSIKFIVGEPINAQITISGVI